jgi:hypothetical protein
MKQYSTHMKESKFKEIYLQYKTSGCTKEDFCALLRRESNNTYDAEKAYEIVKSQLIEKI